MRRIRVLVVDDAVVVRRLVTDILNADPDIEVVGIAANGRIALQKIGQLAPDLITLDVEMPEMDGLETIVELRKTWKTLPVIMFSTLTERGGQATIEALARGATDYVTKPANVGSVTIAQQRVRDELIPRIKALCAHVLPASSATDAATAPGHSSVHGAGGAAAAARPPLATAPLVRAPEFPAVAGSIQCVAIGSSTGGPNALIEIIPRLPANLPVPVVITQHMPPMFTRLMAERLAAISRVRVREAAEGDVLAPGTVWIAPGDFHLVLQRTLKGVICTLSQDPPENSCRPAVDVMLRSAVHCYGAHVLSVILTGMGQDGLRGSEAVHDAGGVVLAQDEATSVVWGMPGFVARAGIARDILPLTQVAPAIITRVMGTTPLSIAGFARTTTGGASAPSQMTSPVPQAGAPWR
jgi:two-component system chemotaxis response regulator CheB